MRRVTAATILAAGSLVGLSAVLAVRRGRRNEERAVEAARARLRTGSERESRRSDSGEIPAPVRRYLSAVLPDDSTGPTKPTNPTLVELHQRGTLRTGGQSSPWRRFEATHTASPRHPGFVWDARFSVAPGLSVRIRDALVEGEATSRVTLFGGLPLAGAKESDELTEASLQRYLAEAVWYPRALVPGGGVEWEAVDDTTAEATVAAGGVTASVTFQFDENDLVERVHADRYRAVGGGFESTPWTGEWHDYEVRGGVRVPTKGAVVWHLPSGDLHAWRGTVTAFERE